MWYLAEILFAEPQQDGRQSYQCESCNVVFDAHTAVDAYRKAIAWRQAYAAEPPAAMRLLGVSHLTTIGERLEDGVEVCGRFFESPDVGDRAVEWVPPLESLKAVRWEQSRETPGGGSRVEKRRPGSCSAPIRSPNSKGYGSKTPNKTLQQTGHANEGCAEFNAVPRVSRLLSCVVRPTEALRMRGRFAEGYRSVLAAITGRMSSVHGYPPRVIEAAEARLGFAIPEALRDYYLSVGRHELNHVHNRLWSPDDLEVSHGRLVFLEENQCVVYWGVRRQTTAADPVVSQTMDLDDGEWTPEVRCSLFLPAMLCWYAAASWMPHSGYTGEMSHAAARRLVRGWPPAGRSGVHSAFVRPGQVVTVEESGSGVVVRLGTRSRRDFEALVSKFGVGVHEA